MLSSANAKLSHLIQSHVLQFNRYACSAASVAMVINAIFRSRAAGHPPNPITQKELLEKVCVDFWKGQLSDRGHLGRHGVSLHDLHKICEEALNVYAIPYDFVELFHVNTIGSDSSETRHLVQEQLAQMTVSENEYILAYFTQGEVVGEWFGSHVSPIGAYNDMRQSVLVLDVDPEVDGPYEAPFDHFFKGLQGRRNMFHRRGGGWVRIKISL